MLKFFASWCLCLIGLLPFSPASGTELEELFAIPYEDARDTAAPVPGDPPVSLETRYRNGVLSFGFTLSEGAWLYEDSLKITAADVDYKLTLSRESVPHTDYAGTRGIFLDDLILEIQLLRARRHSRLELAYQACSASGVCYPEQKTAFVVPEDIGEGLSLLDEARTSEAPNPREHFFLSLFLSFMLGLGLDLTPCVLPLLAVYSAMILGQGKKKPLEALALSLCYLAGLTLAYTALGAGLARFGYAAQGVLQHPAVSLALSAVFVILALDCAGALTLRLPTRLNSLIRNQISAREHGRPLSALLFGALSALLTTPCTSAPLAGALLYVMTTGDLAYGALIFFSIALGMGCPLVIIGLCGTRLIPRSVFVSRLVRRLFCLPLLFAAYYVSSHLLGAARTGALAALIAFTAGYLIYTASGLRGKITGQNLIISAVVAVLTGLLSFILLSPRVPLPSGFTQAGTAAEARELCRGRKCLITFSADWCANCHALDDRVYTADPFADLTADYVKLRMDLSDPDDPVTRDIIAAYGIIGVPTMVVKDEAGRVLKRRIGLFSLDDLAEDLEELRR